MITEAQRLARSETMRKLHQDPLFVANLKSKVSLAKKGSVWPEEQRKLISDRTKNAMKNPEIIDKIKAARARQTADGREPAIGHKMTEAGRLSMIAKKKGVPHVWSKEARRKQSISMMGNKNGQGVVFTKDRIDKISKAQKRNWINPNYVKRVLHNMGKHPNKAEIKLFNILQELLPGEYALNTRAEVMVLGGKIPDIVNVNGQKKLIELWGQYWHRNENPKDRVMYFKQFGDWYTLIVQEDELKRPEALKDKIMLFHRGKIPRSIGVSL